VRLQRPAWARPDHRTAHRRARAKQDQHVPAADAAAVTAVARSGASGVCGQAGGSRVAEPTIRLPAWVDPESARRPGALACFDLAEQAPDRASPERFVLVPGGRLASVAGDTASAFKL
jgi:hypothetical protein